MTPISVLKLLPENKEQINSFAQSITEYVKSGEEDPIRIAARIKAAVNSLNLIQKSIEEDVKVEAEKYSEKTIEFDGLVIEKGSKSTYKYDVCNDPYLTNATKVKKDRETFLKALKEPTTIVDEDTGETFELFPPSKTVSTFLKYSFK